MIFLPIWKLYLYNSCSHLEILPYNICFHLEIKIYKICSHLEILLYNISSNENLLCNEIMLLQEFHIYSKTSTAMVI
jgi:hypothetical protein